MRLISKSFNLSPSKLILELLFVVIVPVLSKTSVLIFAILSITLVFLR